MRETQTNLTRRPAETSLIIQAQLEGVDPQQLLARNLLVEEGLLPHEEANAYVRKIGPSASGALREVLKATLEGGGDVRTAFKIFVDSVKE